MGGIKFYPGLKNAGLDPANIDKLIEAQKIPLISAENRRTKTMQEKEAVEMLSNLISELDGSLAGLKTRYDFYKLKLDSSHPDIIDGTVQSGALLGTYDLEVRSLARAEKELAYGFPDKNETPIGFGYMLIERDDGETIDMTVEPGTTLEKVASQINDADQGVKAMVINTKYKPDPYRLLVVSEKSGHEAKIFIDEDTTFLEFREQVSGRNLDVLFEDVPVTDEDNILEDLIDDVTLNIRRSEPGTRVQVSIVHDLDATFKSIKEFVDKYNGVAQFINGQYIENPETGQRGILSSDSSVKYVMRQLQNALAIPSKTGKSYSSLAEIGISTDSKTGLLRLDESKVRGSLAEDYEGVARLFIRTPKTIGMAEMMAQRIKTFRDPGFGAIRTRMRGLERIIKSQDQEIERRERQLATKEENIKRQFAKLEGTLSSLKGQSDFLTARFANQGK